MFYFLCAEDEFLFWNIDKDFIISKAKIKNNFFFKGKSILHFNITKFLCKKNQRTIFAF